MTRQIGSRGVADTRVLDAMARCPRHQFVPGRPVAECYEDRPLNIGYGQTISQPFMVAYMLSCLQLRGSEKVLEIGTGSGYQTALLAVLAREVYSIERIASLGKRAAEILASLGKDNITLRIGDGAEGWREDAPFDRIISAAASEQIPRAFGEELADNGIIAAPVGGQGDIQTLMVVRRVGGRLEARRDINCRFVPLVPGVGDSAGTD